MRGASKGEGLGNQFLAHIREVDAVAYVLRCFEDDDVTHVEGRIDPIADAETIETELMLADLDSLEKRASPIEKKCAARTRRRSGSRWSSACSRSCAKASRRGSSRRRSRDAAFKALQLLTAKPVLYVCNVDEASAANGNAYSPSSQRGEGRRRRVRRHLRQDRGRACRAARRGARRHISPSSACPSPGLNRLIREGYQLLGLITYFTAGPKEARAWTDPQGTPGAAGRRRHPHRFREGLHPRRDHRL